MIRLYFSAANRICDIAGQAFNVGGGVDNSLSLLELFDLLGDLIGAPMAFRSGPARESDQRVFIANFDKLTDLIGWRPQVGARVGVSKMLAWAETLVER